MEPYGSSQHREIKPNREVCIFILKNKKWVDVFSGQVTFNYDLRHREHRVVFRTNQLSQNHVYRLQNKIRRKGPKAFVVRASTESSDQQEVGVDCILAFRFENDSDAFNFQYFMEQSTKSGYENNRVSNRSYSRGNSMRNSLNMTNGRSQSILSVPTLHSVDGSIRSREPAQVNVLPLTEENLLLHDARMPPRPRKVAEILSLSFRKEVPPPHVGRSGAGYWRFAVLYITPRVATGLSLQLLGGKWKSMNLSASFTTSSTFKKAHLLWHDQ